MFQLPFPTCLQLLNAEGSNKKHVSHSHTLTKDTSNRVSSLDIQLIVSLPEKVRCAKRLLDHACGH